MTTTPPPTFSVETEIWKINSAYVYHLSSVHTDFSKPYLYLGFPVFGAYFSWNLECGCLSNLFPWKFRVYGSFLYIFSTFRNSEISITVLKFSVFKIRISDIRKQTYSKFIRTHLCRMICLQLHLELVLLPLAILFVQRQILQRSVALYNANILKYLNSRKQSLGSKDALTALPPPMRCTGL